MQTLTKTQLTWLRAVCSEQRESSMEYAINHGINTQIGQLYKLQAENMKELMETFATILEGNDKRIKIEN